LRGVIGDGEAVVFPPLADRLGALRPFVVKQIDEGHLPVGKVRTHRRVLFHDLMEYKRKMNAARQRSLDERVAEGQKLRLGY
jgi:excisionase family DNA binding protein